MVAAVTVLWLVAAFLGGAFSLTCFQCNTTGANCEENDKPCGSNSDTCMTTLTEIRQDKAPAKSSKSLVKTCGEKKLCNQAYSMSFNNTSLYASVKCCDGDRCKTTVPEMPKAPAKESQFSCPSCNEPNIKCSNPVHIKCIGEENKCIRYSVKENHPATGTVEWKGCATENVCTMSNLTVMPTSHVLASKFQCNHSPSLLPGLLSTAMLGLVMLKLLS